MSSQHIQVLLIDDHELVRSGIEYLLNQDPDIEVVAVGCSGEDALSLYKKLQPDIILMDINMPGMGGMEAMKRLLAHDPDCKIIAVSVHEDGVIPKQVIKLGVKGYLNKGCPVEEMTSAILAVHRGGKFISSEVASKIVFTDVEKKPNDFDRLSDRELQITLKLIRGYSIQEVADALCISPKTVNTHRYRMHEKLNVKSDIEMMRLAAQHGMIDDLN